MDKKILPIKDRAFLIAKGFEFQEINDGTNNGLIINNFSLPEGKFDLHKSSLLIIIPQGYPDVPPDMFYFLPELRLANTANYPDRANTTIPFNQATWQQWSRHAPAENWRGGTDGIHSYLQRVITALNVAQ